MFTSLFNTYFDSFLRASFVFMVITQGQFCSKQAEPATFSVKHWQLGQNSCLPNDNVLCNIAAVLTAAEGGVLQDLGWGGLDFGGSFNPPVPRWPQGRRGGVAQDSPALPRPLQKLWGLCMAVGDWFWLAPVGWMRSTVWFESSFRLKELGSTCSHSTAPRGSRRGLCHSQRASSHIGTCGDTVRGDGGSWEGLALLQLASLEPIQAVQGLCHRRGRLTRSSEQGCCRPTSRTGRSFSGAQPPASLGMQQSLAVTPSKPLALTAQSRGRKKDLPQPKLQRRSESWSLYCRNPEREGGAGIELPAGFSELLYKAASQLGERDTARGFKVVTLANVLDGRKELFFLSPVTVSA